MVVLFAKFNLRLQLGFTNLKEQPRTKFNHRLRLDFIKLLSAYLSSAQATPGSSLPSRNSSEAPPPVEMWLILSPSPIWLTAAAESPPPMIVDK